MLAGHEGHPGWHTKRRGAVGGVEAHASGGQAVEVRRLDYGITGAAQDVRAVLVGHDDQEIGPCGCALCIHRLFWGNVGLLEIGCRCVGMWVLAIARGSVGVLERAWVFEMAPGSLGPGYPKHPRTLPSGPSS